MAPETRVVPQPTRKIGGKRPAAAAPPPPPAPEPPAPAKKSRTVLIVLLVAALLALAAAAYVFLRPAGDEEAAAEAPEPGLTVPVEAISVNLADGHYLRIGYTIQLTAEAEEIETAKATDVTLALFSGLSIDEVNDATRRTELKAELTRNLSDAYDGEVMAVYYTDYVTQ